jgi:quercetin dioxygenase-like cupin family protein
MAREPRASPKVVNAAEVALGERAARFEGKDHGAQVSFFLTTHDRGEGPASHRHPYEETFIVQEGAASFTVDQVPIDASAGQIVVVPAGAAHAFKATSDVPLKLVSIHPAPAMETEWLE